jgi:phosphate-selective porin OprO/OprP
MISFTLRPATSVAAIAAGLALVSVPAYADMESLLEKLLAKGILSQDEFNEMRQDVREARREAAMEKTTKANAAQKQMVGEGFKFTSGDKQTEFALTGRVNVDYRFIDHNLPESVNSTLFATSDRDTASLADGFELRRARLGVKGFVYKDFKYEFQANAVGGAPTADVYFVNYARYQTAQLTLGRFKQPFSLEELTSSNDIDFAERSYVNQNGQFSKKIGAMLSGEPIKGLVYAASVYQQGFNEVSESDGKGLLSAGRAAANFGQLFNLRDTVVHFGVAGVSGTYQDRPAQSSQTSSLYEATTRATVAGFRTLNRGLSNLYRAQVGGANLQLAGTAETSRAGLVSEYSTEIETSMWGTEAALAYGPVKLQGEYSSNKLNAVDLAAAAATASRVSGDVKTFYAQLMWNITGEKWADMYSGGVFKGVKPTNNFKPGSGWGAWQLGLRYSEFDASDLTIKAVGTGARIQCGNNTASTTNVADRTCSTSSTGSWGLGVNWIMNPNSRFMFEWTRTDFGNTRITPLDTAGLTTASQGTKSENVFSFRTQFNF